jgi:hypothetical protein
MWGRLGPRFAVEAAFLILLAVGLGLADEDWVVIVVVMAAGWALVSVIELVASRRPTTTWRAEPAAPVEAPAEPAPAPPEVAPEQPPVAIEPGVHPLPEPEPEPEPEAVGGLQPAPPEDTVEVAPEDLEEPGAVASSRRRWFRRRRRDPESEPETESESEPAEEGALVNGVSEPPKHVRKLEPDEAEARAPAESAEGH